jgi:hypothetical protein
MKLISLCIDNWCLGSQIKWNIFNRFCLSLLNAKNTSDILPYSDKGYFQPRVQDRVGRTGGPTRMGRSARSSDLGRRTPTGPVRCSVGQSHLAFSLNIFLSAYAACSSRII